MECNAVLPTQNHKLFRKITNSFRSQTPSQGAQDLSFFQLLLKLLFRRKMDSKQKRSSRINEIKKNLWRRGCSLVELKGPHRKLIAPPGYKKTYETYILGTSLMFRVFIENALTMSCPGGCISILCSDKIFDDLKTYNNKNVIVMAGTNNLFDKNDRPLMGPIETSDKIYFLIEKFKFHNSKEHYGPHKSTR